MSTFDIYADRILDVVISHGGTFSQGDPGEVLYNLAEEAEVPYKSASLVVLRLENMGFLSVERQTCREARQSNRIVSISEA